MPDNYTVLEKYIKDLFPSIFPEGNKSLMYFASSANTGFRRPLGRFRFDVCVAIVCLYAGKC